MISLMALPDIRAVAADLDRDEAASAIPQLEQLVDHFPTYPAAYLLLARAYRIEGNRDAALRALAQVQLWSLAPKVVQSELRAIIEDHLDTVYSTTENSPSYGSGPASPSSRHSVSGVRTSPGAPPDDFVEDLQERLGPPAVESDEDIKDLNSLIQRLEGARIQPEPEFGGADPPEDVEAEDPQGEEVVSETLARIYTAQKEYRAAVETYQRLAEQHPDRADEFQRKAREIKDKMST
jgi:tetratricopeptide (TPR) repeat protein